MNPADTSGPGSGYPGGNPAGSPNLVPSPAGPVPVSPPPASDGSVLEVTLTQLEKLTIQYAQDPYELAKEIERLKTAYLSKEFGRTLKAADN